jgi:cytochrome c556
MKSTPYLITTLLTTALLGTLSAADAVPPATPPTPGQVIIRKVMKDHMKGDTSNLKKALKGELDKDTLAKLVESVKTLPAAAPIQGDAASWKTKTEALIAALESLNKGEANAADAVKAASNCKACHEIHKAK